MLSPDGITGIDLCVLRVVAGKEDGFAALGKVIPHAARAVPAAPPLHRQALHLPCPVRAKRLECAAVLHDEGELAQGFRRRDYAPAKAVCIQPRQRAAMVGVGMSQEYGVRVLYLGSVTRQNTYAGVPSKVRPASSRLSLICVKAEVTYCTVYGRYSTTYASTMIPMVL